MSHKTVALIFSLIFSVTVTEHSAGITIITGDGFAVYDMPSDGTYLYLVGTNSYRDQWLIEKRRISDVSLESFLENNGNNGVIITQHSSYGNAAAGVFEKTKRRPIITPKIDVMK